MGTAKNAKTKPAAKGKAPAKPKPKPKRATAAKGKPKASGRPRVTEDPEGRLRARIAIAEKICADYATGDYTAESCCEKHGLDSSTLRVWRREHPEIHELWERACDSYRIGKFDRLKPLALNSFERLVAGYEYEETQTTAKVITGPDGKQTIVPDKITKTKHHVAPSPGMVAMAMRNWHGLRDRLDVNHSGSVTVRKQVMLIGGQEVEF